MPCNISVNDVDVFVFDFDGVLTDNTVYVDQDGRETVVCSRADGLAFDLLNRINKPAYILSTEKNSVVSSRANKLNIPVIQGANNKVEALNHLVKREKYALEKVFYIGNDLNDYRVIQICGYSACPSDSHHKIKQIVNFILKTEGGKGIVRELLEDILLLDFIRILYPQ